MKKMIVSAFALMLTITAANAQDVKTAPPVTDAPPAAQAAQQDEKVKIEIKDLPAAVQAVLASDEFKGWTATTAWQEKSAPQYYSIEMKKGEEAIVVKLDKDGKKVG